MNWHTNPPEWAAYVNQVLVAALPGELHLSADMSCKRVECDVATCEAGRLVIVFHPDLSDSVKWPDDPGPWTHEERSPTLTIEVGDTLADDMECVSCGTGRYTVRATCVRRVDWGTEGRWVDHGPTHRLAALNCAALEGATLTPEEHAERESLIARFDAERLRVLR